MSTILITGASGFIGQGLATFLAGRHSVICMSRRSTGSDLDWVRGDFCAFEDLRQLDGRQIDVVIHLAAVTGGCLERDGILVNVEGTRCLMRYLIDHGCRKFVMASSIAVPGMQSVAFRPLALPISDTHTCLDRDGYGFSKFMMEKVTEYYWRQNPAIDVINLRLASIVPDVDPPPLQRVGPIREWALGGITRMTRADVVRAFTLAAETKRAPGVRILNAVNPRAWVADPIADVLSAWWGEDVDLSYFRQPGNEYASVFDPSAIAQELGFVASPIPGL